MEIASKLKHKTTATLIAIIVLLAIAFFVFQPTLSQGPVSASFEKGTLKPGEETTLIVTVRNAEKSTLNNVIVSVVTSSHNMIIGESVPASEVIGPNEFRIFRFKVTALSGIADGGYSFIVKVPAINKEINAYLEVKT
jgi:hypothetical protein